MSANIICKHTRLPAGVDSVSVLEGTALFSDVLRRQDAGNDRLTIPDLKQKYTASDLTTTLLHSPCCMQPCVFKTHTHCSHTAATNTSSDGTDEHSQYCLRVGHTNAQAATSRSQEACVAWVT